MIKVFRKIWVFSGEERGHILKSVLIGFVNAFFNAMMLWALYVVLSALVIGEKDIIVSLQGFGIMLASVVGKIFTNYFSQLQRVHAGYFMVANKRLQIGDKLRIVPMGYFNQNTLGNISGVTTTVLGDVENTAPMVLVQTLGGLLNTVIFALMIFSFDWRIGCIVLLGILFYLASVNLQERKSRIAAPNRQRAQESLVGAALETIQGMGVVKAFNLEGVTNQRIYEAVENSCRRNMEIELAITPYVVIQQLILRLFSVAIIVFALAFYFEGSMSMVNCLMMLIASFLAFEHIEMAGRGLSTLRLTESSIDRANDLDHVPTMGVDGKPLACAPHDIDFSHVSFTYGEKPVLNDVSFHIPANSFTAIVGPSGSGKTTLTSLIARFWDVTEGSVSIGGLDVREIALDDLMANISMVFQNVYLFQDTIKNNIKFGNPEATDEQMIEAAKAARCHDFIIALPNGYDTVVGEGGSSLSGGEKQRVSIARAMLKNAPIVIFDEATASIDPENEHLIQAAISELSRGKTIITIAHRLPTIEKADQILVIDGGTIAQQGTHETLLAQEGIYRDFIRIREQAQGWKMA